ncbi:ribonuclease H-like domain-containing protein [Tanacetum coccineum]
MLVYLMVTRFRVGTNHPTQRLSLHVSLVSPLPKSYRDAFNDLNWQHAMCDEYNALIKNKTWTLVPRPTNTNIVGCMCLFRHKYLTDDTISLYKARLMANGSTQLEGVDFDETFSPVVKPGTIQTILSLATSRLWSIHQLDVKNAFLNGDLSKTVYMHQPPGFWDSVHPDYVCLLQRSLYGLNQSPRAWFHRFASYIIRVRFHHSRCMFLSQHMYAVEILKQAHMANCNPIRTPVETESKLGDDGDPLFSSSTTSLVAYLDADWAGWPTTQSAEVEYHGVANAVTETCWLWNLLHDLHTSLSSTTLVYCDNVSVVYLCSNPCTKHIEIDIHFVRDLVDVGQVRVLHVASRYQYADIFNKGLSSALFEKFRTTLSVLCPPVPTTWEC